jgi:hypothetical protein
MPAGQRCLRPALVGGVSFSFVGFYRGCVREGGGDVQLGEEVLALDGGEVDHSGGCGRWHFGFGAVMVGMRPALWELGKWM